MKVAGRWIAVLAVVALLAVGLALVVSRSSEDGDGDAPAATTTTATDGPATSTTATTTEVEPDDPASAALWPFPGTTTRFATPSEAARSFATEFLGFRDPLLDPFEAGDSRSGEVPVRPRPGGPVTTIAVRQLTPGDERWSVLAATTDAIELDDPDAGDELSSPVRLRGRARAFEGTVQVEVRQDGATGPLGAGVVTGGGDQLRPFDGTVAFETAGAPRGALVLFTESAEDGQVWEAMAIRVRLRSTDIDATACGGFTAPRPTLASAEQMEVKVYFTCEAPGRPGEPSPFPVHRTAPRTPAVLGAAMTALVAGPTAEERRRGVSSFFSTETAGTLRSATLTGGHAVVDFDDLRSRIPNASSSAGSALLLSELDTTAFQFRSVETVEYRLAGSCEAFNEWLQLGGCDPRARRGVAED